MKTFEYDWTWECVSDGVFDLLYKKTRIGTIAVGGDNDAEEITSSLNSLNTEITLPTIKLFYKMKRVSADEFYEFVRPQNYTITAGENKHTDLYKLRHTDKVLGKVVSSTDPSQRSVGEGHAYFINEESISTAPCKTQP